MKSNLLDLNEYEIDLVISSIKTKISKDQVKVAAVEFYPIRMPLETRKMKFRLSAKFEDITLFFFLHDMSL